MKTEKKYQLKDGTWVDFETYMAHNTANIGQQVLGLYAMLDLSPEGLVMKVKKKHFWNGWDFKSILAIAIPFITITYYAGGITKDVEQTKNELQRHQEIDRTINKEAFSSINKIPVIENKVDNLANEIHTNYRR